MENKTVTKKTFSQNTRPQKSFKKNGRNKKRPNVRGKHQPSTRKALRKVQRQEKKAMKHQFLVSKYNHDGNNDITRATTPKTNHGCRVSTSGRKPRQASTITSYKFQHDEELARLKADEEAANIAKLEQKYKGGRYSSSEEESDPDENEGSRSNDDDRSDCESWDKNMTLDELKGKMNETRRKRLLEENEEEDRYIKSLSKKLKLNKKAKIPESFRTDGLDYLLEICDSKSKLDKSEEHESSETANYLREKRMKKMKLMKDKEAEEMNGSNSDSELDDAKSDDEELDGYNDTDDGNSEDVELGVDVEDEKASTQGSEDEEPHGGGSEAEDSESESDGSEQVSKDVLKKKQKAENEENDGNWEDIYGRLRDKDGNIITCQDDDRCNAVPSKYLPPAKRETLNSNTKSKNWDQIEKSLKGLLNRLSEANLHNISAQVEQLYMTNSRNDMNECLLELLYSALVKDTFMPDRILLEHVMLIAILHANVGTEIGAFFLQSFVQKFHDAYKSLKSPGSQEEESKQLENLVLLCCYMYHFKVVDSSLIYELLSFLGEAFLPKDVELILTVLRSIGFRLRKDDPVKLKEFILLIQKKAADSQLIQTSSRVKFMLEILLAIRNNNMTKIPNYDPSFGEHLLKIIKSHLRKGTYVSELKISMDDLLNAEAKGRWWIVGSAWTNTTEKKPEGQDILPGKKPFVFSEKLLADAKAQGMNTEIRRNIFCILMTAEDYLDAFEKLIQLGLKNQMEREIVHVIIFCCLQEKKFNPFYCYTLSKLSSLERRFMLTIQYTLWDRLKDLKILPKAQHRNLAQILIHLINEKILPITVLKIIDFTDLDEVKLEFIRQTLVGVLLQDNSDTLQEIFTKLGSSKKFSLFRESLKLFLLHFLLKHRSSSDGSIKSKVLLRLSPDKLKLLKSRVELVMVNISNGRVQL